MMMQNQSQPIQSAFDIRLSEAEMDYLRAAGMAEAFAVSDDRAAVMQAMMQAYAQSEDAQIGGPLTLTYKFGILRAMFLHRLLIAQEKKARVREEKTAQAQEEEETRLREEFDRYVQMGAQAYMKANPMPFDSLALIMHGRQLAEEMGETLAQPGGKLVFTDVAAHETPRAFAEQGFAQRLQPRGGMQVERVSLLTRIIEERKERHAEAATALDRVAAQDEQALQATV
jgi:hypothetical protein